MERSRPTPSRVLVVVASRGVDAAAVRHVAEGIALGGQGVDVLIPAVVPSTLPPGSPSCSPRPSRTDTDADRSRGAPAPSRQARPDRPPDARRPPRGRAPPEAPRAADLLVRPDLLGGVRDGGGARRDPRRLALV